MFRSQVSENASCRAGPSMHSLTTASMMELDFITEKGRNAKQKRARMRGIVSRTA